MTRDLTVGRPARVLWVFCLPLFGSIVFQQLYNIADSLVAGKFIGEAALAAVGNSYEITLILLAFSFGCNIGCSVVVSRLFGAGRMGDMKTAISTAMVSGGAVCAALMAAGFLFARDLLLVIRTPEAIMADSALYLNIYLLGLPFVFVYNISTGVFTALGDSKTPFVFLACSSTSNVLMDILFVKALNMGVAGVAWATFLCQGAACVLAVAAVFRRLKSIRAEKKPAFFSKALLWDIWKIAIPSTLQQSFISVGNVLIQSIINGFGEAVIAGYAAAVKMNNLVITSFTTIGNGMSNYTSQNIGAGKPERVREGLRAGVGLVWMLCLPLAALYFFFGEALTRFFIDRPTAAAMSSAVSFLRILSPFYFVIAVKLVADGVLRGEGKMNRFMAATLTDLALRVVLAYALSRAFGSVGIWCAWPGSWCVATAMSVAFCVKKGRDKTRAKTDAAVERATA